MKIHKVIGSVTLNRCHPGYASARLLATESCGEELVTGQVPEEPELVIVWDDRGAGLGNRIAISDGAEAAQAFRPELKAVDAYCSAILDSIDMDVRALEQLQSRTEE